MTEIKRMFVNQPSSLQPHHDLHGARVLAIAETETHYRVYFTEGSVFSMRMTKLALSKGWPNRVNGPAVEYANGSRAWWVDGEFIKSE